MVDDALRSEAKTEAAGERSVVKETVEVDGQPTNAADAILAAIAGVSKDVRDLGSRIDDHDDELRSLRRAIHGSKRPPDMNGSTPLAVLANRGSQASFDVEELRGELLAVRSELAKQSGAMGIGKGPREWFFSAAGGKTIVRLLTLAGAAYTALHAAGHC